MKGIKINSISGRRVLVSIAIAVLLSILLTLYYFVYAPKQQLTYNKSAFRVLERVAHNFSDRIDNSLTAILHDSIFRRVKADEIRSDSIKELIRVRDNLPLAKFNDLKYTFHNHFIIDSAYEVEKTLMEDSVYFFIANKNVKAGKAKDVCLIKKSITDILDPIVKMRNNTFESIVLIKANEKEKSADTLLYNSGSWAVGKYMNLDSLKRGSKGFTFPLIADVNAKGTEYKLFLFPFRMDNQSYFLGGFITNQLYKSTYHNFPLNYFLTILVLVTILLLSLPFLKIFLIGSQENIRITDVRAVIGMLFLIPFLFILIGSGLWIRHAQGRESDTELKSLHDKILLGFYNEIGDGVAQLQHYDRMFTRYGNAHADSVDWSQFRNLLNSSHADAPINFKDVYLHPKHYKNFDGVFWINASGTEIAKWNFKKLNSPNLFLSDRQYFKDIISNAGYKIRSTDTVMFSIQPTSSRATGDYTINLVTPSHARFNTNPSAVPLMIGLSAKMYTMYQPVLPKGYAFCIVNAKGDILYHSESNRSLEENLFDEADDNYPLQQAIANRQLELINNVRLYDRDVKVLTGPISGLPEYFLVTYYTTRDQDLFTLHIVAFTFLCESLVLLMISVFILYFYFANRSPSRLFFTPHSYDWIKPNIKKKKYYIINIVYQLIILLALSFTAIFIPGKQWSNYVLYASILLPFFLVTGYYLMRTAETNASIINEIKRVNKRGGNYSVKHYQDRYLTTQLKILIPYAIIILVFNVFKGRLINESNEIEPLDFILFALEVIIPLSGWWLARRWHRTLISEPNTKEDNRYLFWMITGVVIAIIMISVIPTLGFLYYSSKEEISLRVKLNQMHLAKNIQQHRTLVNDRSRAAKYGTSDLFAHEDSLYVKNLKFSERNGLYLINAAISAEPADSSDKCCVCNSELKACAENENADMKCERFRNSAFYRRVTNYLFLPADHFDFFRNTFDYYWKIQRLKKSSADCLTLVYKNLTDPYDGSDIRLSSDLPHTLPFFKYVNLNGQLLFLLVVAVLSFGFVSLILTLCKRIFLIGYFEVTPGRQQDISQLNKIFSNVRLNGFEQKFLGTYKITLHTILQKERNYPTSSSQYEECILKIHNILSGAYEAIWKSCSLSERSVVYDFALDGFTNYRNVDIIYSLYKKGILKKKDHHLAIMTNSFRNFLITKTGTPEIQELQQKVSAGGQWGNFKSVFYIILFAIIIFLFIVQEDLSKRILAIITTLGAAVPVLLSLFGSKAPGKKTTE